MNDLIKRILTSMVLLIVIIFSFLEISVFFIVLFLIFFISLSEFNLIFKNIFKKKKFLYSLFFFISLIYLLIFSTILWIYLLPYNASNKITVIFLLIICSSTDIGGYVFGKVIGGKKFTKISPNKTYSGILGSFIFASSFGCTFFILFKNYILIQYNIFVMIFIVSILSQIGDLLISFLKRKAKMKDTGSILPGHGGILDRVDGILLALPLGIKLFYL